MKIYTNTFDLRQPSEKKFWVAPHSDFKIGIKVIDKNGNEVVADGNYTEIELYKDGKKLTVDSTEDSMLLYKIKSEDTGEVEYTVKVAIPKKVGCGSEGYINGEFTLIQSVTNSTVYERESGGEIPSDLEVDSIQSDDIDAKNIRSQGGAFYMLSEGCNNVYTAKIDSNGHADFNTVEATDIFVNNLASINGCGAIKGNSLRIDDIYIDDHTIVVQGNNGAKLRLAGGCGSTGYLEIFSQNKTITIQPNPSVNISTLEFKPYYMQELNGGCGGYVLAAFD